jgi:hypothetical protein
MAACVLVQKNVPQSERFFNNHYHAAAAVVAPILYPKTPFLVWIL